MTSGATVVSPTSCGPHDLLAHACVESKTLQPRMATDAVPAVSRRQATCPSHEAQVAVAARLLEPGLRA